eukprot:comp19867_c0_seq1/m.24009 comp19867_c0_seq1/g.24009  ORF comp19867_c0_seq1/g.24009 comp19867_c0_seq1/m.24009 type:complete len:379 (-) comp19867_c0_seq1:118-1254(-)
MAARWCLPRRGTSLNLFSFSRTIPLRPTSQTSNLEHTQYMNNAVVRRLFATSKERKWVPPPPSEEQQTCAKLSELLSTGKQREGWAYFSSLRQRKTIKPSHYSILIAASPLNTAKSVVRLLKADKLQPNLKMLLVLIEKLSREKDTQGMFLTLQGLIELGLPPTADAYTRVTRECAEHGDLDTLSKIMLDMQSRGVAPNKQLFFDFLRAYIKTGNFRGADKIIAAIRSTRIVPIGPVLYQSILSTLGESGQALEAEGMLHTLPHLGFIPGPKEYQTVIGAYTKAGDRRGVERVLVVMRLNGVPAKAGVYDTALGVYPGGRALEGVEQFLDAMDNIQHRVNPKALLPVVERIAKESASPDKERLQTLRDRIYELIKQPP